MKHFWDRDNDGKIESYDFLSLHQGIDYFSQEITEAQEIIFVEHDEEGKELAREAVLVWPAVEEDYSSLDKEQLGLR